MALRRLTTGNFSSATLLRSISAAPSFSRNPINHHDNHPQINTDIPPSSRPNFSNMFDPLAPSMRSATQGQLMNHHMQKSNLVLLGSNIMGIGGSSSIARDFRSAFHLNMYNYDGAKAEMKRSFSSSAASTVEQSKTVEKSQLNANIIRPLSPHLPVYKPQTNSVASIFNRISGAYLAGVCVAFYLLTMSLGPICFTYYPFYQALFYSVKVAPIAGQLSVLALAYHVLHTTPHIVSDVKARLFLRRVARK